MQRRGVPIAAVALVAAFAGIPAQAHAGGALERARAYLGSVQMPSGGFQGATIVDAVEAASALEAGSERDAALLALSMAQPDNNEAALARLAALAQTPFEDMLGAAAYRSALGAGDLGLQPGSVGRDPIVLAWALRFAVADAGAAVLLPRLSAELSSLARSDGGFGFTDEQSDVAVTAEVARAFALLPAAQQPAALASAVAWLRAKGCSMPGLGGADLALLLLGMGQASDTGSAQALVTALLARQDVSGAVDADVRTTALAAQALRFALPDLAISFGIATDDTPATGARYSVTATVQNVGRLPSGSTAISYAVVDGSGAQILAGSAPVAALVPGQSVPILLDLGTQGSLGWRTLTAVVNPSGDFSEGRTDNNIATLRFRVAGLPDLVIDASDLSAVPTPPALYRAVDVTVRVRNLGDATARNVHAQLFWGEPGAGGVLVSDQYFNAVAAGTPRTFTAHLTPTKLEPMRLIARVDPENAVVESNEGNNVAELDLTPVEPATMTFNVAGTFVSPPPTVTQGNPLTIVWGADLYPTRYGELDYTRAQVPFQSLTAALAQGSPSNQLKRVTVPATNFNIRDYYTMSTNGLDGTYVFYAIGDPDHLIPDTNPSDNIAVASITITTPNLPELWVDPATVLSDPPLVTPGATCNLHGTLHNTGKQTAANVRVDAFGQTTTLPIVAPGDSVDVAFQIKAPAAVGQYPFYYLVDPLGVISEGTKANNTATGMLHVGASDLDIVAAVVDPDQVAANDPASVNVTFKNIGTVGGSGPITVTVLDPAKNKTLGTSTSAAYPSPGTTGTASVLIATAGYLGDTPLQAQVTHSGSVGWPNTKAFVMHVRNPDFSVSAAGIQVAPAHPAPGAHVQAQVVVNNSGAAGGSPSVRLYRGYKEQGDLVASGTLLVTAGGSAVFQTGDFTIPTAPPFVLTAVVDEEGAYTEANKADNMATRDIVKGPGEIVVAFDETKPRYYTTSINPVVANGGSVAGGYAQWAKDLEARGYTVLSVNPSEDGIAAATLRNVDVLVSAVPTVAYSQRELDDIELFVASGGGFLFIGDYGGVGTAWVDPGDPVLGHFGWTNAHTKIGIPGVQDSANYPQFSRATGQITNHAAMVGINLVCGSATGAVYARAGSTPLVKTGGGQIPADVVAVDSAKVGDGRMAVLMDSNFLQTGPAGAYYSCDNLRFGAQLVDWLVNGTGDALPDLAFIPEQLVAPSVVTSGDQVVLSVRVKNIGGNLGASAATVVRFYDGDPAAGKVLGEAAVPSLGIDEGQTLTAIWDTTAAIGDHVVTAVVDPDNTVAEFDEKNNTVQLSVHVQASYDLRLDPSDITIIRGPQAQVSVRVHNQGYAATQAGVPLDLSVTEGDGTAHRLARLTIPAVPARSAVTVSTTWLGDVPSGAFTLTAAADPGASILDADTSNNGASVAFAPPSLEILAPLAGTTWGGSKTIAFAASSATRGGLNCNVAIAPAASASFTGIVGQDCGTGRTIDTHGYADGDYVVRVTAFDGLQSTSRDVALKIDNATPAVRTLVAGATVTVAPGSATAALAVPVGTRVLSATLLASPVRAASTTLSATAAGDSAPLVVTVNGSIHAIYKRAGALVQQSSGDGGATWTAARQVTPPGTAVYSEGLVTNGWGLHLLYACGVGTFYMNSPDGIAWSNPVTLGTTWGTVSAAASEDKLVLASSLATRLSIATADGSGTQWTALQQVDTLYSDAASPVIIQGELHLFNLAVNTWYYRHAPLSADLSKLASYGPVMSFGGLRYGRAFHSGTALLFQGIGGSNPLLSQIQRCPLSRDCSSPDSWLPEPIVVASGVGSFAAGAMDDRRVGAYWYSNGAEWTSRSQDGGASWSDGEQASATYPSGTGSSFLFAGDATGVLDTYAAPVFYRYPGFAPTNLSLDIGNTGVAQLAWPALERASQSTDFSDALNSYLATHVDGDDGHVDGYVSVPISIVGGGAGSTQLANVEVRYQQAASIAGYASPPLFSPGSSPGSLDTSNLSVLGTTAITVMTTPGVNVRTLPAVAVAGRYVATFDGRDDSGALLPSGLYPYGGQGAPVEQVEIDNILPTATLNASAQGSYGGMAPIQGVATDADWAGTPKNFARYVLEYTLDGTTYRTIANGTSPVNGVLGVWDARTLSTGSATLRLTVYDRAGNSAVTARSVNVSPGAPQAPTITGPTIAGVPIDSTSTVVSVVGAAEPSTTVTVFVNGIAVGSTSSDGQWALAGVSLPPGVATITASAMRSGSEGPRAQSIQVANYKLVVGIDAPATTAAGGTFDATVSVDRTSVSTTPLSVRIWATDLSGNPAPFVTPVDQVVTVDAAGHASFPLRVDTLTAAPGTYVLGASIVQGGLLPATASTQVVLVAPQILSATLASDRATYDALQAIALTGRVINGGHGEAGVLTAVISVVDPSGQTSLLGPYSIANLPAGLYYDLAALYASTPHQVGSYSADLTVTDLTGSVVAQAQTSFAVQAATRSDALLGSLTVNPASYLPGDRLDAQFTVTNRGGDAPVPVSLVVLTKATSGLVARWDGTVPIAVGGTVSGTEQLGTIAADGRELSVVLLGRGQVLAVQSITVAPPRDTTPPGIVISGFTSGECRAGPVTPVITITDESLFTSTTSLNGQVFTSGTTVQTDGAYTVAATAVDAYGNAASTSRSFSIDTVPPDIQVNGVSAGELTNAAAVTLTVTVSDLHLSSSTTTLDGQSVNPETVVTAEGDHLLSMQASDHAGNQASKDVSFSIDRTPPTIGITGITEGDVTNLTVFPAVSVTDPHLAGYTVLLDGMTWLSMPIQDEGEHVLSVEASDLAGNTSSATVHFTIDKTPPMIVVAGVVDGVLVNHAVQPIATVTDAHPGATAILLDNAPFSSGSTVAAEGVHLLAVHATDGAGNFRDVQVHFVIDKTPPSVIVSGVTDGQITNAAVTPTVLVTDAHPGSEAVQLDGQPFVSGALVQAEGDHVLTASATDAAGNPGGATVHFTIDVTPPSLIVTGVQDGATYSGAVAASWTAADAHLGSVTAALDGQPYTSGSSISTSGGHTLLVTAHDLAGNTTPVQRTFTITPVDLALQAGLDTSPSVLVAIPCDGRDDDDHHGYREACDGGQHCSTQGASVFLSILDGAGIPYEVVFSDDALTHALRTLGFNVVVLYKSPSSSSHWSGELVERVYAGTGLVVVNTPPPDNDPKLQPALGVSFEDNIGSVGNSSYVTSEVGPGFNTSLSGGGVEQSLQGATSVGSCSRGTILSIHPYGAGRAATLTFDPEANGTNTNIRDLLVRVVTYASGGTSPGLVPGEPVRIGLTATLGSASAVDAILSAGVPPGVSILDVQGGIGTSPVTWMLAMRPGGVERRTLTLAAQHAGTYTIDGALGYVSGSQFVTIGAQAEFDVLAETNSVLATAVAAVSAIPATKPIDTWLKWDASQQLAHVTLTPSCRSDGEAAIEKILRAISDVAALPGPQAVFARATLDKLLRAAELAANTTHE